MRMCCCGCGLILLHADAPGDLGRTLAQDQRGSPLSRPRLLAILRCLLQRLPLLYCRGLKAAR